MWWKYKNKKRDDKMMRCHCHQGMHCGLGGLWLAGWMFTIGLLKLTFWKAVLAIVIWAYYLGAAAAHAWGM